MTDIFDELFSKPIINNQIGGVVCCMNRERNLFRSLRSWIKTQHFKEIIVLDYGSKIPIKDSLPEDLSNNPIIKIYRYNTDYWHLTKAYNIAIQLSSCDIIAKLDTDYFLFPKFFEYHNFDVDNEFITGNHCVYQPLWGFLMFNKKHFLQVNGYNERMIGWGHDDVDINIRLKKIGLKPKIIKVKMIKHLNHEQKKNINVNTHLSIKESQKNNKHIMIHEPWTTSDKMSTIENV